MQSRSSATSELQNLLSVAPPNFKGSKNNPAAVAHAALEALRDSGDPKHLFLRTIIEKQGEAQSHEELLFHCITGCRQVILNRWHRSGQDFIQTTRDFFLVLGHQTHLPRTLRMAAYTSAASFWKRQWNQDAHNQTPITPDDHALIEAIRQDFSLSTKQDLFLYLESIILPNHSLMATGATFLSILIGEFMGKSTIQYNLPLEFHKQAHDAFENHLESCLNISMSALSHVVSQTPSETALPILQVTIDIIGWQFGSDAWDAGIHASTKTLIRPPASWRDYLIRPDFCGAIFNMHNTVSKSHKELAHRLRQLLLLLASISGPIFTNTDQRKTFCTYFVEGALNLLSSASALSHCDDNVALLDVLSIISRLIANFKLPTLIHLPAFEQLLNAVSTTGAALLSANVTECETVKGDVECMENREWREEVITVLLEGLVLLCGDPWLIYSGQGEAQEAARAVLSKTLPPLYKAFISCRIQMAKLEEHYLTSNEAELDEVREEISAVDLEEEMSAVALLGRLDLEGALAYLATLFQPALANMQQLWSSQTNTVTAEGAALLEETRLLIMCLGYLITDENSGETPVIPESVLMSCDGNANVANTIASAVKHILQLGETQALKLASNPHDPSLSPLLATALLWFLVRWCPVYILPINCGSSSTTSPNPILTMWNENGSSSQVVNFCLTLCVHYHCFWPQERQVQESATSLLLSLSNRKKIRTILVSSPALQQLATYHCLTASLRHNASPSELETAIKAKAEGTSIQMVRGYQRLPYDDRARLLTGLLFSTCSTDSQASTAMFTECLGSVQTAFLQLVQALSQNRISSDDINAREMACLCVELYGGVVRTSEIMQPERIPQFMTPALPKLSGLMAFYAVDLSISEALLRLFRDYTEQFVVLLDREQSLALFNASADLLKSYSALHCTKRVVSQPTASSMAAAAEEEQKYSDVLCAIQLLIHLGTKDFIDTCTSTKDGIESGQVTDVIFYGLQQIIPLMSQGLLHYPSLCTQYFSLVGFMMDTYPDKVCALPYDLFDALLESLLFGMSNVDTSIGKSSLYGIAGIVKEHIKSKSLSQHLSTHPDMLDRCSARLLQEVVFQSVVWDRLEPTGMVLLPLAAADINRFASVVSGIAAKVPSEQSQRLQSAFGALMRPEMITKISSGGYDGRMNRLRFKKDFELFVKEVHSFLLLK